MSLGTTAVDVAVIGAGPTGLTMAIELARRGIDVRIVDAAPRPFAGSRGKGVTARTLEVFDDLGIVEEALAGGFAHLPHRVTVDGQVRSDGDPRTGIAVSADRPYPGGIITPQWRTESQLRARLRSLGVKVEYDCKAVGFGQYDDHAEVRFADGGVTTARYVVGCDGGRSAVRAAMGISFHGTGGPQGMLIGDVRVSGPAPDRWYQWIVPQRGFVALCPFRGADTWQFQGVPFADFDADGSLPEPSLEYLQRVSDDIVGPGVVRLSAPDWMSRWKVNVRIAGRFRSGRFFLAGDAAHVHPPTGGLGMNTGIQDAYNLGWKLAAALRTGAADRLLDTYEDERIPVAEWTLGVSAARLDKVTEDVAAGGAGGIAGAVDDDREQLGLGYRFSSLSRTVGARSGSLQAGDRAPDAVCRTPDGRRVRLFDVFRGTEPTVLLFDGGGVAAGDLGAAAGAARVRRIATEPGPDVDLVDVGAGAGAKAGAGARTTYSIEGPTAVVVRPDGYVGLLAKSGGARVVRDYLTALGGR